MRMVLRKLQPLTQGDYGLLHQASYFPRYQREIVLGWRAAISDLTLLRHTWTVM